MLTLNLCCYSNQIKESSTTGALDCYCSRSCDSRMIFFNQSQLNNTDA